MIKHWYVTGDIHGKVFQLKERLESIKEDFDDVTEVGVIILGDAGFNFYMNSSDDKNKRKADALGCRIYCVRGNHEERPEFVKDIVELYDNEIGGTVLIEPTHPNIRYLLDGRKYWFGRYSAFIIGGAYSVDKRWRLANGKNLEGWTGWFENEQLSQEEMNNIELNWAGCQFDFVFSHTCPISWQPTDMFLPMVDQSSVDNTMELWMEDFKDKIYWGVWLFGHFHADRAERPNVQIMYNYIEDLNKIWDRWNNPDNEESKWMLKGPLYYADNSSNDLLM